MVLSGQNVPAVPGAAVTALPIAAVDLGGTRVRAAVIGSDGALLRRVDAPTDHNADTPEQIPCLLRQLVGDLTIERAVVGTPGRIEAGSVGQVANLPQGWLRYLNEDWLSRVTGLDVTLAGDAELAAVGEAWFGAGTSSGDMAYLTLSTGVGGAALTSGRLIRTRRTGLLIGLVPYPGLGDGPLDLVASSHALRAYAAQSGHDGVTAQDLVELAGDGHPEAMTAWKRITDGAAWAAVLLSHLVCPDVLVIGGGLAMAGDPLLGPIDQAVRQHGPQHLPEPIRIAAAALGDDAGLRGAAAWHLAAGTEGRADGLG